MLRHKKQRSLASEKNLKIREDEGAVNHQTVHKGTESTSEVSEGHGHTGPHQDYQDHTEDHTRATKKNHPDKAELEPNPTG